MGIMNIFQLYEHDDKSTIISILQIITIYYKQHTYK